MRSKRLVVRSIFFVVALAVLVLAARSEKHPPSKPIDLNLASAKELQQLPGVGLVTAQRIIELRQKSGHFKRVEDLLAVRGISQKKLDALRPYVTVSVSPAPPARNSSPQSGKKP